MPRKRGMEPTCQTKYSLDTETCRCRKSITAKEMRNLCFKDEWNYQHWREDRDRPKDIDKKERNIYKNKLKEFVMPIYIEYIPDNKYDFSFSTYVLNGMPFINGRDHQMPKDQKWEMKGKITRAMEEFDKSGNTFQMSENVLIIMKNIT